jgi:hypothetical protein
MVVAQYRLRRIALPGIERTGFQLIARGVSVSHAYAHVVDCGEPVDVAGLRVNPGDMLHRDGAIAHSSSACYVIKLPTAAERSDGPINKEFRH